MSKCEEQEKEKEKKKWYTKDKMRDAFIKKYIYKMKRGKKENVPNKFHLGRKPLLSFKFLICTLVIISLKGTEAAWCLISYTVQRHW